jgi:RND family efflux transporter MFP subunit
MAVSSNIKSLDELRIHRDTAPRRSGPALVFVVLLVLIAVGAGAAYWWYSQPKAAVVRTVVVQAPSAESADKTLLNSSGYVTARRAATVSSKVTGKVVEVLVEEGMEVADGQVLARVDPSNVEQSLRLAEAQLDSSRQALAETRVNIEQAERDLRRMAQLVAEHISSQSELDLADAEAKSLKARLSRQEAEVIVAEREVALWTQQLDDTIIRAPFSGVVTSKDAQPGEMISPMSSGGFTRTGICTVVDMSSLEIEVDVGESYINRVTSGQPVVATLDSYPELKIPAHVIAIIPTADRQKATVKVRVGFDAPDPRILPDMSVKVAFQSSGEPVTETPQIRIPESAVFSSEGQDVVFVVNGDRVERRAVTVDIVEGDEVTIAAGIGGGERVVVEGPDDLADGAKVTEANP